MRERDRRSDGVEIVAVERVSQLDAVRELWLEYYHVILEEYGVDMGYEYFRAEMTALPGPYAPPKGRLRLARVQGSAAGCAGLRPLTQAQGQLKRLYVRPACRGQGVGRALITSLIDAARQIGYEELRVHTAAFLTEAVALYRSLGFEPVEQPGTAEMFMTLSLE